MANKSVGVIGLGLVGEVFSRRLIDGGQSVVGYDIDAAKGVRLAKMGGRAAASIAELARACDPIVLAVFDTPQVEDVVENQNASEKFASVFNRLGNSALFGVRVGYGSNGQPLLEQSQLRSLRGQGI